MAIKNKKFTILTSCYNGEKYIKTWLKSVAKQKYRPLEVVFVNDASTSKMKRYINKIDNKLSKKGIEFKYIKNSHRQYCGSSYKIAVQYATGSFFGVLDIDDMLVSDAVEYIMSLYSKHENVGYIYTQFYICDENMKKIKRGWSRAPSPGKTLLDMGRKHYYSHWRTFSKRVDCYETVFKEKLKCAVDKYMGYKLEEIALGMFADRVCYLYRQEAAGISARESGKKKWERMRKQRVKKRNKNNMKIYPILLG